MMPTEIPDPVTAPPTYPADAAPADAPPVQDGALGSLEQRGIEPVPEEERHGNPLELFWVWFAANISVLGLPLGVSLIALGLSVWQSILVAVIGAFGSFAIVGLISIAGRRGGAPSLTLSRAIFGTRGNAGPTLVALLSRLGWETVNTSTAALAVVTIARWSWAPVATRSPPRWSQSSASSCSSASPCPSPAWDTRSSSWSRSGPPGSSVR
jgi:cytosine/uracil/thiamine/allantoin permease